MKTFDFKQQWDVTTLSDTTFQWKSGEAGTARLGADDLRQNVPEFEMAQSMNLRTPLLRELLNPWDGIVNEQVLAKPAWLPKAVAVPEDVRNVFEMPEPIGDALLKGR